MAAYWVKMIPWAAGLGIMGSGTIAFASLHSAYEVGKENERLKCKNTKLHLETIHLCQTLVSERENAEREKKEILEQNTWTTKLVGAGMMGATALGGVVGYSMR